MNEVEKRVYKVVTKDIKSLGLRRNPNVMTFSVFEWISLSDDQLKEGKEDWGGIWTAKTKSGAKALKNYMRAHYGVECRIFEAQIDNVLFQNSYRVKTNAIFLEKEID